MSFKATLRQYYRQLPWVLQSHLRLEEARLLRQSHNARLVLELLSEPRRQVPGSLARFEQQVFSQGGEDGILREIFRRIGEGNRYFIEFGVEDGLQNNTHFLLQQGWKGAWLEGNPAAAESIRRNFAPALQSGQLKLQCTFITAENIGDHFRALGVPPEPDLLGIDLDGNDFWIWQALREWRPRVVSIEYNAQFPADCDWVMPYNATHQWKIDTYYGASLKALTRLGAELGYRLVGCCLAGTNAFFVRNDLAGEAFAAEATAEFHYEPPRYYLIERVGHRPSPRIAS